MQSDPHQPGCEVLLEPEFHAPLYHILGGNGKLSVVIISPSTNEKWHGTVVRLQPWNIRHLPAGCKQKEGTANDH
jgi:hypothetical protein